MKCIKYLIGIILCAFIFSACSQTEDLEEVGQSGKLSIVMDIDALDTRAIAPLPGESTITDVYIVMYPQGEDNSVKPIYFEYIDNISAKNSWTHTIAKMDLQALTPGVPYDVYVLAALDKDRLSYEIPTRTMSKSDFLALNYHHGEQNDISCIAFTGYKTFVKDDNNQILNVSLERIVARLDINLVNMPIDHSISYIEIGNVPAYTPLQRGHSKMDGTISVFQNGIADNISYNFYIFETTNKDNEGLSLVIALQDDVTGELTVRRVTLSVAGSIERNKVYAINVPLN